MTTADRLLSPSLVLEADFEDWCRLRVARTERALEAALPAPQTHPARLHQAIRYATLGGGKRIRPLLVHGAALLSGARDEAADAAACAVEMIHAYSLVHDDMPCMDDDAQRRGKPTVHVAYGEATAMLVGDALQALAFEVLARAALGASEMPAAAMLLELARAAGPAGMVGGQAIDIDSVGTRLDRAALEQMHRRKTGALLRAALRLGWMAGARASADAAGAQALDRFATAIGLAFQVVDDILDVESDAATLGKTVGKDAMADKPTFVSLMGLEPARALACELRDEAHHALERFGAPAARLAALADLIVLRKS